MMDANVPRPQESYVQERLLIVLHLTRRHTHGMAMMYPYSVKIERKVDFVIYIRDLFCEKCYPSFVYLIVYSIYLSHEEGSAQNPGKSKLMNNNKDSRDKRACWQQQKKKKMKEGRSWTTDKTSRLHDKLKY